jgi:hypothetical protein
MIHPTMMIEQRSPTNIKCSRKEGGCCGVATEKMKNNS